MKNTLADLNNHLFMALERLNSDDLQEDELKAELKRAGGVSALAEAIIHNADVQLKAIKLHNEYNSNYTEVPQNMLPKTTVKELEHKDER